MTFTDDLRKKLRRKVGICPTCGQTTLGLRVIAKRIGVSHTCLWRFLKGNNPSSKLIDSLVKWMKRENGTDD